MDVKGALIQSTVLLSLLTHFSRGQNQLIAPSEPLIAPVGSTVVLPCELDPVRDFGNMAMDWSRPDLRPRYVHIRRDGVNLLLDQNPLFLGRTALSERTLKHGDMSLKLSRVKLSDNGTYRCYVPTMDISAQVQLLVVSVSSPSVSLTKGPGGSLVLQCSSGRWYPEPELQWLDSEGTVLPGGAPQTHVMEALFTVSSRLSVEQGSSFTCRVSERGTKQSRETLINITDEFREAPSCSVPWTLFSLGLLLLLIPVVFFVWKFKFSRKSNKTKTVTADSQVEEQKLIMTSEEKSVDLNQTKYNQELKYSEQLKHSEQLKYSEDLRRIEDELQFVDDMIEKLKETMRFQTSLKEKLHMKIHQLKSNIRKEEEEKKNKMITIGKDKHGKRILKIEKQVMEFENILENTERQLEKTEPMIRKTIVRKDKLERDKKTLQNLQKQEKSVGSARVVDEVNSEIDQGTSQEKDETESGPENMEEQGFRSEEEHDLSVALSKLKMQVN